MILTVWHKNFIMKLDITEKDISNGEFKIMRNISVKDLTIEEKLRLLCSNGFWYTMDFNGKIPAVSVSDGPVGLRAERKNENGEKITLPSVSYPSAQSLANTWNVNLAEEMGESLADDCYEKMLIFFLVPVLI